MLNFFSSSSLRPGNTDNHSIHTNTHTHTHTHIAVQTNLKSQKKPQKRSFTV
jgi:hypothetical protein